MKTAAIVLAAGRGKRMGSEVAKQYLLLAGKPVLFYSLKIFTEAPEIDHIIVVTGPQEQDYVRTEIIERYHFTKVKAVAAGGKERFHSVYNGLKAIGTCDYVFIHDGARPLVEPAIITRAAHAVREFQAAAVGMPAKDTVKIANKDGYIAATPNRELVWTIQTPQAFAYPLIMQAYETLLKNEPQAATGKMTVTDDAMVVETFTDTKVKLVEGSYRNIKITTPEDLKLAAGLLT